MFEPLKAKLSSIEAKLRACLGRVDAAVAQVEAEVDGLDKGLMAPLDGVVASVGRVEAEGQKLMASVSARVAALTPPPGSG